MNCDHCAKRFEGDTLFVNRNTGFAYCSPDCIRAGRGVFPINGYPQQAHCARVSCLKPLPKEREHWKGLDFCSRACVDAVEYGLEAAATNVGGPCPCGDPAVPHVHHLLNSIVDTVPIPACGCCKNAPGPYCAACWDEAVTRVEKAQDLLRSVSHERNRMAADIEELLSSGDAERVRFADTVCAAMADLTLERQRHEVTQGLMEDLRVEQAGEIARLTYQREAAKKSLAQLQADFRDTNRRYSNWKRTAEDLQELVDRKQADCTQIARAYLDLRRLCYFVAFAFPFAGAVAATAATYWHTLLPWLTTHAPSTDSWCLLAVGLACLLVGRRWRRASYSPTTAPRHCHASDPLFPLPGSIASTKKFGVGLGRELGACGVESHGSAA